MCTLLLCSCAWHFSLAASSLLFVDGVKLSIDKRTPVWGFVHFTQRKKLAHTGVCFQTCGALEWLVGGGGASFQEKPRELCSVDIVILKFLISNLHSRQIVAWPWCQVFSSSEQCAVGKTVMETWLAIVWKHKKWPKFSCFFLSSLGPFPEAWHWLCCLKTPTHTVCL